MTQILSSLTRVRAYSLETDESEYSRGRDRAGTDDYPFCELGCQHHASLFSLC